VAGRRQWENFARAAGVSEARAWMAVLLQPEQPEFWSSRSFGVRDFSPAFDGPTEGEARQFDFYWHAFLLSGGGSGGMNPAVESGTKVPHSKARLRQIHQRFPSRTKLRGF